MKPEEINLKHFLGILSGFALALAVLLGALNWYVVSSQEKVTKETENLTAEVAEKTLTYFMRTIVSDLLIAADHQEMKALTENNMAPRNVLEHEFLAFSRHKALYDQVRFLDMSGNEIIRINFNEGSPVIVPPEELQNKAQRYYFTDAAALAKNEIFISPLDINIEGGQIERPSSGSPGPENAHFSRIWRKGPRGGFVKPMIRIATPVFNSKDEKVGVLLLNFFGVRLLNLYEEITEPLQGHALLLNREGYWLKGLSPDQEWGFMEVFSGRPDARFQDLFPEAWKQIKETESGQVVTREGLFTFRTVFPLPEGLSSSSGAGTVAGESGGKLQADQYWWKIVSYIPLEELRSRANRNAPLFFLLFSALCGCFAVGLWMLLGAFAGRNKAVQEREQALQEVQSSNDRLRNFMAQLEEKVLERTRELEQVRGNLESAVEEKTRQLREANRRLTHKVEDLEGFTHMTVDRELRMFELKKQVNALLRELGREPRYDEGETRGDE